MRVKKILFIPLLLLFLTGNQFSQTFTNVAPSLNIVHQYNGGFNAGGVTFCDYDNNGFDDILFCSSGGENIKVFKNVNGQFTEVAQQIGISNQLESKNILVADFDNDGDRDIFISNLTGHNRLYKNEGNSFTDITSSAGISLNDSLHSTSCIALDYNKDGLLDIYSGVYSGFGNNIQYTNHLYKNNGNNVFSDVTVSAGCGNLGNKVLALAVIDYNNDGWDDIYIASDRRVGNTLLKNNGNGTFSDVSVQSGSNLTMDAMGLSVADYDNDNDFDIYISNGEEGNSFLKNNGNGTFTDVAAILGMSVNKICWGNNFYDYDNDGDLDLFITASGGNPDRKNVLFKNNNNGTFTKVNNSGIDNNFYASYGNALGDFDNNGYCDMTVLNDNEPCLLWKSNGGSNKWIKIKLQGTYSNRDAVGSLIKVYSGGTSFIRRTSCGSSYCSQNSFVQTIGVGYAVTVDSITVIFPSGIRNTVNNVNTNQTITIVESGVIGINGNNNQIPTEYKLSQNYPNPFNPSTIIEYSVPQSGLVVLKLYNSAGIEISSIVNEIKPVGNYSISITENITGKLASGVYFYQMISGSFLETKKMILIK